ncbi:TPA: hypothetical protein CPT85_08755 [Candidatus Gastranaerophilales bacterium HUM_21]|nr:MAG TPA: hypothetical protein CPT85_08755 [Candidatus Gastranaerophilales bacterium HUM_21]
MAGLNIAFIPIDNRPVCYTLAQQIAAIDRDLALFLPPREMLGDLNRSADINGIFSWLKKLENIDSIVVSLDTIAYGGLIPSRRSSETFEEIKKRMESFFALLREKNTKVYAFSSIMRISNNNINEEEKEYWSLYGEKIFKYSYELHKNAPDTDVKADVPPEIIQDYLKTRQRNFEINKMYLNLSKQGVFETLVFSKDDCAQYGLNVGEAQVLEESIRANALNALVKTGADEIPLSLLSRALAGGRVIKIAPVFTQKDYTNRISKYEDVSVSDSVRGQIELAHCEVADVLDADIILVVNNFKQEQGELVMGVDVEGFDGEIELPQKPYLIADILNANGADNSFVKKFFEKQIDWDKFLGYAGWNTTGNTLGSALCCAIVKFLANNPDEAAFKKVQAVRFLDDWAYQANVRKALKLRFDKPDIEALKTLMQPFEKTLQEKTGLDLTTTKYSYPWNRFFEIEVSV